MSHPAAPRRALAPLLAALALCVPPLHAVPDRTLADFETEDYHPWTAAGDAFAPGPQNPQNLYPDRQGARLALSRTEFGGDSAQGTLTSPPFTIDRAALRFLAGGGAHPGETGIRLLIDDQPVLETTGFSQKSLTPVNWDLRAFTGRTARLQLFDQKTGRWGHIAADHFVLTDDLAGLSAASSGAAALPGGDILLGDFSVPAYAPWFPHGKSFGTGPTNGAATSSDAPGIDAMGSLFSPDFTIDHRHLNFRLAAGPHAFRTAASLWIDGRVVRTTSGDGTRDLAWHTWDLAEYQGRTARIGLHDLSLGDEPHGFVIADDFALSSTPRATPAGDVALAIAQAGRDAVAAIRRNAPRAAADPHRPVYHYTPPSQRMNDPNGPAWHDGWHHLFYQHMVFVEHGSATNVHWGHARSRDLVNWETLPLAIAPAYEYGEISVFSGNLAYDKNNRPVQLTTMVPYLPELARRIWPARPADNDWIRWTKIPAAPEGLLPQNRPEQNMKDAFPFSVGDRRFSVLTADGMPIYEAVADDLSRWEFRGYIVDKGEECPNFFELDGRWVYLSSPHSPPRYMVGDFDPATARFTPRVEGRLHHGPGFYATTAYRDDQGRTILHGVSRGQRAGQGWTGALALPRVLTLGPDERPRMQPAPGLETLRRDPFRIDRPVELANRGQVIESLRGDTLEIIARFRVADARSVGLRVRRSDDGTRSIPVMWNDGRIIVNREDRKYPCAYELDPATRELTLRVFLDKGVLDALTGDGRVFESRIHYAPVEDLGVEIFAEGGSATLLSLQAWRMAPAQIDHSRLLGAD